MKEHIKLGELFGHKPRDPRSFKPSKEFVLPDCLIGVEIELEGCGTAASRNAVEMLNPHTGRNSPHIRTGDQVWELHTDGSLRDDGIEFVSLPVLGKDLSGSIIGLEKWFQDRDIEPRISERCSVHIHMNVQDMELNELIYLICLYTVFESMLFKYCGEDRADNFYCLPYYNSDVFARTINTMWMGGDTSPAGRSTIKNVCKSFEKYSALNIGAVNKYGTLEFRHHKGCYHAAPLMEWINILLSLKKAAIGKDPKDFPEHFSAYMNAGFGESVFGDELYHKLRYRDMESDLIDGIRVVQDILRYGYIHNNMKKFLTTRFKPKKHFVGASELPIKEIMSSRYLKFLTTNGHAIPNHSPRVAQAINNYYTYLNTKQAKDARLSTRPGIRVGDIPREIFNLPPELWGDPRPGAIIVDGPVPVQPDPRGAPHPDRMAPRARQITVEEARRMRNGEGRG